jgi:hypothetical protein
VKLLIRPDKALVAELPNQVEEHRYNFSFGAYCPVVHAGNATNSEESGAGHAASNSAGRSG